MYKETNKNIYRYVIAPLKSAIALLLIASRQGTPIVIVDLIMTFK